MPSVLVCMDEPEPLKAPVVGTRKAIVILVEFTDNRTFFCQRSIKAAAWFTTETGRGRPTIYTLQLNIIWPARLRELVKVVHEVGATQKDLDKYSEVYGEDYVEYLFVPKVLQRLKQYDVDGYVGWDILERDSIQVAVPLRPSMQIRVVDKKVWKDATSMYNFFGW